MGALDFYPKFQIIIDKKNRIKKAFKKLFAQIGNFSIDPRSENDENFHFSDFGTDYKKLFEFKIHHRSMFYSVAAFKFHAHCTSSFFEQTLHAMYSPPEPSQIMKK